MPQDEDEQDVNLSNDAEDGDDTSKGEDETDTSADDGKGEDDEDTSGAGDDNVDDVTDPDELKEKLKKTTDANKKLFARLQDAKGLKLDKATGKWVPKERKQSQQDQGKKKSAPKKDELTTRDLYALMDAKVPKQDIEEVQDYAKLKGITIEEALETSFVKARLETLAEERTTADAANTGPSRGGSTKPSKAEIKRNAETKGELPDDQGAIEDLVESRLQERIGNK